MLDTIATRNSEKEKQFIEEVKKIWQDLLSELKTNNYLRRNFEPETINEFILSSVLQDHISEAFNALNSLFEPNQKVPEEFFNATMKYNLTRETIPYIYFGLLCGKYLMETEQMKATLLMILEKKGQVKEDLTLGQLIHSLKIIAPKNSQKLIELKTIDGNILIDVELRNSIGHGSFWIQNKLVTYKIKSRQKPKQITTGEFLLKTINQNLATKALIEVISDNAKNGFFKSG